MKTSVKTAAKGRKSRIPLRSNSLTTFDIGTTRPVYALPLLANETLHFNMRQLSELSPLVVKTFGELHFKHTACFVPHRVVWRQYEDYRRSSQDASISITPKTFLAQNFYGWFGNFVLDAQDNIFVFASGWTPTKYIERPRPIGSNFPTADIVLYGILLDGGTPQKIGINLTKRGREVINTLYSLGYRLPVDFCGDVVDDALIDVVPAFQRQVWNSSYDALALLSYARCLYDYIFPSRYIDFLGVGRLWENDTDAYGVDDDAWYEDIFSLVFTQYDNHFFTSLFLQPNNPIAGQSPAGANVVDNVNVVTPQSQTQLRFVSNKDANVIQHNGAAQLLTLSSYALRWLQSASDYILRNNIGGRRFREWAESHFGFVTKDQNADISEWISSWQESIDFRGVQSTAETDGARLGDQAGHGSSFGQKQINFTAHEDGFFFVVTQLIPSVVYYQGQAPWTHPLTSALDLYTPEFEAQGFEAVPIRDVFVGQNGNTSAMLDGVFGYCPRYSNRYKRPYDSMSGDFVFGSRNSNMQAFHTFRDLTDYFDNNEASTSLAFLQVENQFGRIFQLDPTDSDRSSLYDKVFTLFAFDANKESHLRSLSDSLPLFDKSGQDANINYLGD